MDTFIFIICVFALLISIFLMFRNSKALSLRNHVRRAILEYRMDCFVKGINPEIMYEDMESFYSTVFRFWDFSHKRILPKDKYKLIKKYLYSTQVTEDKNNML